MNRTIKRHNIMPEDQCAQSGKHGNEASMLKLLHCNINSAIHAPHAAVSADLKNVFDSAQQAVACMSVRSMGVSARIVTMFLLCFQMVSFHLSTGYGISEDFFSSSEETCFASLLRGSGLAPLTFVAMTARMLYSYKDKGHSVNYVSPVSPLLAVTLAAVISVDDTDLIFASDCKEETMEGFIDKVQEGISGWSKTVMAIEGEVNLKKGFAKI